MEDLGLSINDDDPSRCIICLTKVSQSLTGDCSKNGEGTLQKMAPKSVVKAPGFLTTFNTIWESLHSGGSSSEEILLTSLITGKDIMAPFSKAPTFCKPCCQKIVAVENLIKAVKRHVGEIKLILEESRRKAQSEVDTVKDEDDADEKEEDWEWEESVETEQLSLPPQQTAILPVDQEPSNSAPMECDDDDNGNSQGATEEGEEVKEEDEDDSNWAWDDDDPDYIKSEEDDNANDDYEYDEEYTSEEDEEEPLTIKLGTNQEKDPLEMPGSSSSANQQTNSCEILLICKVEGCGRSFQHVSGLQRHRKLCHPNPKQQKRNLENLKKAHLKKSPSSPFQIFSCNLEACSRKVASKESLIIHQRQCHLKTMIALGRIKDIPGNEQNPENKFPCSCGQVFTSQASRYKHQSKSKLKHPEFQYKLRELRSKLENGQRCDICDEPVKLTDILEHLTNHLGGSAEYVVKCPNFNYCGHMFTHSKRLNEDHLQSARFSSTCRKVAEERKFDLSCETCDYTTDKRVSLPAHVNNEHERGTLKKNLSCPISSCGKMFATKQGIYFHLHAHRYKKITIHTCKFCLETIKIEDVEGHFKEKHEVKEVFGCKECPVKFAEREDYLDHLWDHRHIGLSCDICGDSNPDKFVRYFDLREHYFVKHQICPRRFQCEKCPSAYWRKPELSKHYIESHRENAGADKKKKNKMTFKCDLCFEDNSFTTKINLLSHKIRVHGAEPFRCEICSMTFHLLPDFNRHRKIHAGAEFKNEWKCEVEGCGKILKSKRSWRVHSQSEHEGVKPHVCKECGKRYALVHSLKAHQESVHLRKRPWICEECGEGFSSVSILKRHKLIHTGERPFECEICGQRFRHGEVLRRHKIGHEKKGAAFKPNGPMKQIRKRKAP